MFSLLVAYTTYDGHTAKIAERIASTARVADCAVEVCDLARTQPERPLWKYDGVVARGPLHGGKHARRRKLLIMPRVSLGHPAIPNTLRFHTSRFGQSDESP